MITLLAIVYNLTQPYIDLLRKKTAQKKYSSLTILHAPNLLGHPLGIAALFLLGMFVVPTDPVFFLFWFMMIAIASVQLTLNIWGMLETKFFGVQILSKLSFVVSSVAAILIIGEPLSGQRAFALGLATVGVVLFAWPTRTENTRLVWDRGIFFVLVSVVLSGFTTIFYKLATLHTASYSEFLTGRFVGDLIGWTAVWLFASFFIVRRNPFIELGRLIVDKHGGRMILVAAVSTLVGSWLIFKLPVTTISILSTLTIPTAYLIGRYSYDDHFTTRMWLGSLCIVVSVLLFIIPL